MLFIQPVLQAGPDLDTIKLLFKEYIEELDENLGFQSFDKELENPLLKYGALKGALFLAFFNEKPAACIALQPLEDEGVCEMKRLFVRQPFRKFGIADELVTILLKEAKAMDYKRMVLDTLERLQPAIKLYLKHGFSITSAYYQNPLPGVVFMEKTL
jgi:putative acetyltransferase